MLAKIKSNALFKLIKHEIDKLSNMIIISLIISFVGQLVYKIAIFTTHIAYKEKYFLKEYYDGQIVSDLLLEFLGVTALDFTGLLLISLLVILLTIYSINMEFNKKTQSAYSTLLLPQPKWKILLAKVITLLGFFIIAYGIFTLVDIVFSLVLINLMLPAHADYTMENLVYILPTLQFYIFFIALIISFRGIGLGLIIGILTKGLWKPIKFVIVGIIVIIILLVSIIVRLWLPDYYQFLNISITFIAMTLSFILFSKKSLI